MSRGPWSSTIRPGGRPARSSGTPAGRTTGPLPLEERRPGPAPLFGVVGECPVVHPEPGLLVPARLEGPGGRPGRRRTSRRPRRSRVVARRRAGAGSATGPGPGRVRGRRPPRLWSSEGPRRDPVGHGAAARRATSSSAAASSVRAAVPGDPSRGRRPPRGGRRVRTGVPVEVGVADAERRPAGGRHPRTAGGAPRGELASRSTAEVDRFCSPRGSPRRGRPPCRRRARRRRSRPVGPAVDLEAAVSMRRGYRRRRPGRRPVAAPVVSRRWPTPHRPAAAPG